MRSSLFRIDAEVFVYGGGGYGTLQEYIVLDKYFDQIKPNLVILQVSANDFINNSLELESLSYYNNNLMIRPYLIHGTVEYHFPRFPGKLRIFLSKYSRLFYFLFMMEDRLIAILAYVAECRKGYC